MEFLIQWPYALLAIDVSGHSSLDHGHVALGAFETHEAMSLKTWDARC